MKKVYANMRPRTIVVLWVAKLVACVFLGYAGYLKLSAAQGEIDLFTKLGMEPFGRYVIGSLEILAVILLLIPQSAIYGAILALGVMVGAVIGHLTAIGLHGVQFAVLVLACCTVVLYIRRHDADFLRNLFDRSP